MAEDQTPAETTKTSPQPFFGASSPFRALKEEMDRMFHSFSAPHIAWNDGLKIGDSVIGLRVDIAETDDEIQVKADLPGLSEDDVEVTLDDDMLSLRAEKKSEAETDEKDWKVVERSHGVFERRIRVPGGIDADQVVASFDKGVLTVTLPKPAETASSARKIAIQSES